MDNMEDIAAKLGPVTTKRASEIIYEQIKALILSDELKPGQRLPSEREMMDLFHRSRPTVREALRMLERSGLIRTSAGSSGAIIMNPDENSMEESVEEALRVGRVSLVELGEYRQASESAVIRWACQRRTQEDLDAMKEILQKMADCIERYEEFVDLDAKFHGLVARAGQNQISVVMNRTFSKLSRSFVKEKLRTLTPEGQLEMNKHVHAQHVAIFEAIRDRNEEQGSRIMSDHLSDMSSDLKI